MITSTFSNFIFGFHLSGCRISSFLLFFKIKYNFHFDIQKLFLVPRGCYEILLKFFNNYILNNEWMTFTQKSKMLYLLVNSSLIVFGQNIYPDLFINYFMSQVNDVTLTLLYPYLTDNWIKMKNYSSRAQE